MKKLIFDIAITGHHSEYVNHLVDYLHELKSNDVDYYFLLHPEFSKTFPKIYEKAQQTTNVYWNEISLEEFQKTNTAQKIRSSWLSFKILHKFALEHEFDHVYVLDFHTIKYAALFYRTPYTISTILFLLFHRLKKATLGDKIEFYKRYYITKFVASHKNLKHIFILNDQEGVNYLNAEFKTDIFKMLPDPIPQLTPLDDFDIHKQYGIEEGRVIFLHIGSLGNRKGTLEVIESVEHISISGQNRVAILIVGKTGNLKDEQLYENAVKMMKSKTNAQLVWHNEFVPTAMMKSLFDQSEAVLIPYKNAEFSSGILGHAAAANKMVIATGSGLIGQLVTRYQLGSLLVKPDALNLAKKIEEVLGTESKMIENSDFVKQHSPRRFSKTLLET